MRNVAADSARRFNVKRSGGGRRAHLAVVGALLAGTALAPAHAAPTDLAGVGLTIFDATINIDGYTNSVGTAALTHDVAIGGVGIGGPNGFLTDSGAGVLALIKTGAGLLSYSMSNSYSGGTTIQQGTLSAVTSGAFGTGQISILNGSTLASGGFASVALNNALFIGAGTQNILANNSTLAVTGAVTGNGDLVITGGNTTLGNMAGFTGTIALNNANYFVTSASSLGTGVVGVTGSSGLLNNSGSNLAFSNVISGAGVLNIETEDDLDLSGQITVAALGHFGPGVLTLRNANNQFSLTMNGGTVAFTNAGALGDSFIAVGASSTLRASANNMVVDNQVSINGGTLTVNTQANTLTMDGSKSGTGGLTKIGSGTLILNGTNDYDGTTVVNGGTLRLLGTVANDMTITSTSTLTGTGSVFGTVTVNNGGTIAPGLSPGLLTFGNLVLNNASNLNFELAGLAAVPGVGADLINVTGDLTLDGVLNITALPGFNVGQGQRTLITYGNLLADNELVISNVAPVGVEYSILVGGGVVALDVDFTGVYQWDGGNFTPNGVINGGTGTWNLTNTNFTNADGTFNTQYENDPFSEVQFGGVAGAVTVSAPIEFGIMKFFTSGYTLGGAGSLVVTDTFGSTIEVADGLSTRIDTVITGSANGGLIKDGGGQLVLTGTNTYGAGTVLAAGTLRIDDGNTIGSGLLLMNDGTTLAAGLGAGAGTITILNPIEIFGDVTFELNGTLMGIDTVTGAVSTNGTRLVLNGDISGGGFATGTTTAGTITLNGNNSFTGDVALNGAIAIVGTDTALGVGNTVTLNTLSGIRNNSGGSTRTLANDFYFNDPLATIGGAGNIVLTGNLTGDSSAVFNKVGTGTVTLNTLSTLASAISVNQGELSVTGVLADNTQQITVRGGATLSGDGVIFGTVTVDNAGILSVGVGGAGQADSMFISNLLLNSQSSLVFDLGAPGIDGGPLNDQIIVDTLRLGGQLTVRETDGGSFGLGVYNLIQYDGPLAAGSTAMTVASLPGAFSGLVQTVVPGEVNLIVTAPGTLFQYWDGSDLTGGDDVITGGTGTWNAGNSNWTGIPSELNTTWFNGSVAVFTATAGTVTVDGTFNAQGLIFETDGYVLTGGKLDNQSTGVGTGMFVDVVTPATATINTEIQGDGILFKDGGGTLVLGFANTNFSGATQVRDGALQLNDEQAAGSGVITLFDLTTLINGVSGQDVANNIVTLGEGSIDSGTGTFTLSGVISGNGSIIKENSGLLILTGTNTYVGGTVLQGGTVQVSRDANLGDANGSVTFNSGSTLVFENGAVPFNSIRDVIANTNANFVTNGTADVTLNGIVSGGGGLLKLGEGTLVLTGTNSYLGGTGIENGVLSVSRDANLGAAGTQITFLGTGDSVLRYTNGATPVTSNRAVALSSDGTIETTGTAAVDFTGIVTGTGKLNKTGSGTLGLYGNNNYSGGTDIEAGTVVVNNSNSLGTGDVRLFSDATLANLAGTTVVTPNNIETLGNGLINATSFYLWLTGTVSGAGSISQVGTGLLALSGNNSFTNLGINSGTVALGSDIAAGIGTIAINNDATLGFFLGDRTIFNDITTTGNGLIATGIPGFGVQGLTVTLNGNIGGPGSITKLLAGNLVLNGDNSFVNLGITEGTVTLGTNTAAGVGSIAMFDNTTLAAGVSGLEIGNDIQTLGNGIVDQGTGIFTLNGDIGGPGSISAVNSGNLVLNGDNSFTNLGINNGRVTVGSDTAAGIGSIAINNDTTLANNKTVTLANTVVTTGNGLVDVLGGTLLTLNGNVGGPGSISQIGAGNLVLNGDNSFTNLGINQGTVTVGSDTAAGIGSIAINNDATLANNKTVTLANSVTTTGNGLVDVLGGTLLTLNGNVGGPGSISQVGAGNLVLNGDNSFTNLGINAGTVTVGSDTAAGIGSIAINNDATLANNKDVTLANSIVTTANGLVDVLGGTVLTLDGDIGGPGSISQVGAGNLVLNGDNSFTNLGINNGTVTLGTNTAAGIGGIAIANDATLAAGVSGLVIANGIQSLGNGIVDQGTGIFTLNGNIAGPGSISAINTGNLVLNGDNSFVNLGINQGTVTVGSDTAAGVGDIAIANNATLAAGGPAITLANDIQSLGNGIVDQGSGVFTLNGDIAGPGSISAVGTGNLVLNGNNSFTNLGINQGTVTVGSNTAAGNANIALFSNTTLAAGGPAITLANAIQTLGNGIIDQGSGVFTLNGNISGAGSISAVGTGNLVLNGNNSFTNLGINQGTVTLGTNTAAGIANIAINNNATLAAGTTGLVIANAIQSTANGIVDQGTGIFTLNGNISGPGSISAVNTGNLVLNGNNSFTNLGINQGTVTLGTNTAAGNGAIAINNNATLAAGVSGLTIANGITTTANGFVNSGTGALTLSGVISGAGSLTKLGTGQLNLTAASNLTGATIVRQGTLNLTGSIASSATTVQTGATLIGTGTTGALNVQAGGTVSPGSTPGAIATLNVNGAATLAGTYNVNLAAAGGADRITATGPLSLGGSLVVSPTGTFNTFYQGFTVASGSTRSGTFASTSLGSFGVPFVPVVEYTGTSAIVRLNPASLTSLAGPGLSGNALAVANAFDAGVQAGYNPQPFFNLYLQGANMQNTLSEMSGELHAAGTRVLLEDTRIVRETAFNRLNWGMASPSGANSTVDKGDGAITFWITGAGSWGSANEDGIGSSFSTTQTGVLSGIDYVTGEFKLGAMFTWTNTDVKFDSSLGQTNVSSTGGAIYAGWRQAGQGFVVNAGGSVAGTNFDGSRSITAPGLAQTLTSDYGGTSWQLFGEVAYDVAASDTVRIEPFARYAYANTGNGGWFETGGIASLEADSSDSNLSIVNVGGRAATNIDNFELMGSVSWQGTYGDRNGFTSMGIIGLNSPAGIQAVALDENAVALEFLARYAISSKVTFGLGYSGLYGSNNSDSGVRGTLTVGF